MSATYDLSRLNVLLVEDSNFMQNLLGRVLRNLDIRQVTMASDGAEAIHLIKKHNNKNLSLSSKERPFNLIICDWVMSPIDGKMLLQWLRTHKDSPDPFLPFVMLTGLSDAERVMQARNLGANEFLAKPFSVATIADIITRVIENPRHFVITKDYLGPDRRRKRQKIDFSERRTIKKSEIKVVQAGHCKVDFKEGIKAYFLQNPHDLRKVTVGLGKIEGKPVIDNKLIEAAELELEEMDNDYADWVKTSIVKLKRSFELMQNPPVNHYRHFSDINAIAHELRGQGETFGYPLITIFGKSLFEYTRIHLEKPDDKFFELLNAHINLIQIVIRDKIRGDGGDIGKSLRQALNAAKQKYENQKYK